MTTTATTIARGFVIRTNFVGPTTNRGSRVTARYARDNETTYRVMGSLHRRRAEPLRAAQPCSTSSTQSELITYESIGAPRRSWNV